MLELSLFLGALVVSFLLTGASLRFSLKRRLLDVPNDRSSHRVPKPRLGGVAITVAFYLSCLVMVRAGANPFPTTTIAAGVFGAGAVIALLGLADDLRGLNAPVKLFGQLLASALVVASGVVLEEMKLPLIGTIELGVIAVPFTVLWIIAIVNFYNFIDGIDGLAAGTGMIAAIFLLLIGKMTGAYALVPLYAVISGALLGFLRFNFPPARIFMGDMGSTFIGFMFAVLSVAGAKAGVPAFVTVLLLAGVLGDAVLTLMRRVVRRERIFSPHRTHYYQRLTTLGLSHKQVTLLEYLFAVLLGVSALFAFRGDRVFITSISVIWIGVFLWAVVKIRSMERGGRLFWEGRALAVALFDLLFIAASYVLSYYLRLNFRFTEAETASMIVSLPLVLVIRTAVFFYYGHYRGVWRYTTFDDLVRMVKAVTLGTLIMVGSFTFMFRFEAFPRSVFIIDWFILIVFLAGSRIATRWFHELPVSEEVSVRRVVIGGTGPVAEVILHHVKKAPGMRPVGYLDDRAEMAGRLIHGMEVLGPFADVVRIAKRYHIEEILIPVSLSGRLPLQLRDELQQMGATVRVLSDPGGLVEEVAAEPDVGLCRGSRILVAGNGELAAAAPFVFSEADSLVILSGERRVLDGISPSEAAPCPHHAIYLGLLGDRRAIGEVLDRHTPDFVFTDFSIHTWQVRNPIVGFCRTMLEPAERIAAEALRSGSARIVVVCALPAPEGEHSARAQGVLEAVLFDRFRNEPDRLTLVRTPTDLTASRWTGIIADLIEGGGGLYAVREGRVERLETPRPHPDIGRRYLELVRNLDEGKYDTLTGVLREMEETAAVGGRE
jgi:UDP-GlcNAc:undecaprenyl-phosphate GlcNAc-1-phosphate transferase